MSREEIRFSVPSGPGQYARMADLLAQAMIEMEEVRKKRADERGLPEGDIEGTADEP